MEFRKRHQKQHLEFCTVYLRTRRPEFESLRAHRLSLESNTYNNLSNARSAFFDLRQSKLTSRYTMIPITYAQTRQMAPPSQTYFLLQRFVLSPSLRRFCLTPQ